MLALVSYALAAGPHVLPGADTLHAGEGDVEAGVVALGAFAPGSCIAPGECGGPAFGVTGGPVLSGRLGVSDRVAVEAVALGLADPDGPVGFAGGAVAIRGTLVDGRHVRLAPWVAGVGSESFDLYAAVGGLALDVGGERVRFDLSVPLVAAAWDGEDVGVSMESLVASEVGVAWRFADGHAVRVGFWSLLPGVGWSWAADRWTAEASVHSVGVATVGDARVGVRF